MKILNFNEQTKNYFIDRIHFTPEMLFNEPNLPLRPNMLIDLSHILDNKVTNVTLNKIWLRINSEFKFFYVREKNIDFTTDGRLAIVLYSEVNKEEIEYVILLNLSHYHQKDKVSLYVFGVYEVCQNKTLTVLADEENTVKLESTLSLGAQLKELGSIINNRKPQTIEIDTIPKTVTRLVSNPHLETILKNNIEVVGFTLNFATGVKVENKDQQTTLPKQDTVKKSSGGVLA